MTKQEPSSQPPHGSEGTESGSAGPDRPIALSQEEVDGLVAGTIDSSSLADRFGDGTGSGTVTDVVTDPDAGSTDAEEQDVTGSGMAAGAGTKAAPEIEPPG